MKHTVTLVAALALAVIAPNLSTAGDDAEAVITYRQAVMGAAGRHMKASGLIVKGQVARRDDLAAHATALADNAKMLSDLFPAGTGPDSGIETDAKAEIWSQSEEFQAAQQKYTEETAKLAEVAKGGDFDAYKAQFGNVGQSCGDCHDVFRVEHDH